jgi:hypothetical protein
MIAWLIGIITVILVLVVLWRLRSSEFRARAEYPKVPLPRKPRVRTALNAFADSFNYPKGEKRWTKSLVDRLCQRLWQE